MDKRKLTPNEIATSWRVSPLKILGWIHSGELRAIDASTNQHKKPRYLVDVDDLADFESRRTATATS